VHAAGGPRAGKKGERERSQGPGCHGRRKKGGKKEGKRGWLGWAQRRREGGGERKKKNKMLLSLNIKFEFKST
jgi:hypothetical protein